MRRLALFALTLSLAACGSDERTRNEAMLFLDRYEEFDIDDDLEVRREAIERLRAIALTDEDVRRARDACVDAYGALVQAEDEHADARHQLVVAQRTSQEIPAEIQAQIQEAIDASSRDLERSQELLPRCTREVNGLETRFHRRRHD